MRAHSSNDYSGIGAERGNEKPRLNARCAGLLVGSAGGDRGDRGKAALFGVARCKPVGIGSYAARRLENP
jgi:hypothetical protein